MDGRVDEQVIGFLQRSSKYGAKKEAVVILKKVEKGRHSYFVVKSKDGHIFKVPSKYLKRKNNKIRNAIKLPVPDTSKPSINKPNESKKD